MKNISTKEFFEPFKEEEKIINKKNNINNFKIPENNKKNIINIYLNEKDEFITYDNEEIIINNLKKKVQNFLEELNQKKIKFNKNLKGFWWGSLIFFIPLFSLALIYPLFIQFGHLYILPLLFIFNSFLLTCVKNYTIKTEFVSYDKKLRRILYGIIHKYQKKLKPNFEIKILDGLKKIKIIPIIKNNEYLFKN